MEKIKPKFRIGQRVKIIKYGHLMWGFGPPKTNEGLSVYEREELITWYDLQPNLVGQHGIITDVQVVQNTSSYSLGCIDGKSSWYNEGQLELTDF